MKLATRWFCAILFVILSTISGGMLLFLAAAFGFGVAPTALLLVIALLLTAIHFAKRAATDPQDQKGWTVAFRCGLVCLIILPIALRYYLQVPPSDQSMLAQFNQRQATFDQLVAMAHADPNLGHLAEDWIEYANPDGKKITLQRVYLYRRLEREAKLPLGFSHDSTDEIEFEIWRAEFGLGGIYDKGFVYLSTPPKKTYEQLDGFHMSNTADQTVYRHIQGHWYLYNEVIHPTF